MCGCGTICELASEQPLGGRSRLFRVAGDIDARAVSKSAHNMARLRGGGGGDAMCDVVRWDAARLPLRSGVVDQLVTDLPFGKRMGEARDNRTLYPAVVAEFGRCLRCPPAPAPTPLPGPPPSSPLPPAAVAADASCGVGAAGGGAQMPAAARPGVGVMLSASRRGAILRAACEAEPSLHLAGTRLITMGGLEVLVATVVKKPAALPRCEAGGEARA